MTNLKLRYLIVVILLLFTTSVVFGLQHNSSPDETKGFAELQKIPMQIGKWKGQDLPLDESVYEILETRNIIHRTYTDDLGNTVLLSIVHYSDTKVDFHTPEACLGGRGDRTSKRVKNLDIHINNHFFPLEVAEIVATNPSNQGLSYYFYKTGNFMGQSYIRMRFDLAKGAILQVDKGGSLIRISSIILNQVNEAEHLLENFLSLAFPFLVTDGYRKEFLNR